MTIIAFEDLTVGFCLYSWREMCSDDLCFKKRFVLPKIKIGVYMSGTSSLNGAMLALFDGLEKE